MPEDEQKELLELINNNGLQLLHLINELLSLSDIIGNSQTFERTVTDIDQAMSEYASETRMQLKERVEIRVEEPVGGLRAFIDAKLLRLVTMHMLDNARLYTSDGTITLAYYRKDDGLYVEVRDTGSGLPDKLKENIFALLSDRNTYIQEETPGLGLSICKAIIDKVGGKVGVTDNKESGRGSIFWFWTPVKILT
jgi:K+-sensing histidine kinase KdpD